MKKCLSTKLSTEERRR